MISAESKSWLKFLFVGLVFFFFSFLPLLFLKLNTTEFNFWAVCSHEWNKASIAKCHSTGAEAYKQVRDNSMENDHTQKKQRITSQGGQALHKTYLLKARFKAWPEAGMWKLHNTLRLQNVLEVELWITLLSSPDQSMLWIKPFKKDVQARDSAKKGQVPSITTH